MSYFPGSTTHPPAAGMAVLDSPAFVGTPTGPTAAATTSTTQLATTAMVQARIGQLATVAGSGAYGDLLGAPLPYGLPTASSTSLGGVKAGVGLAVAGDGTLSTTGAAAAAVQAVSAANTSLALAFTPGVRETSYAVTLGNSCVITIGNAVAGFDQVMTIDLIQGGGGGNSPSFANVSWAGGVAPAFNTSGTKRDTIQVRGIGNDISGYPVSMGRIPVVMALPGAPSGIMVTAGSGQNIVTVPSVTAYPVVSGYNLYAGPVAGGEAATPIASNVALPYVDAGAVNGVTRFYKVAAVNSMGVGAMSPEGSGMPGAAVPGAPSSITVTPGSGQNTVSVPAVTATPAVSGYNVYRGSVAGAESGTAIATNVAMPYVDAGLAAGTYYYKVAAVNSAGAGALSPEQSGTPIVVAAVAHYATFSGANQAIYAPPSASFNPGSSSFDLRARVRMASWATGGAIETNLFGCWDGVTPANRLWRLGVTTDGRIRASWATNGTTFPTAASSVTIGAAGNTDVWLRAAVTPATGNVAFYTSADGSTWTALGVAQTASGSGGVYTPGTAPYLVIGQNASASSVTQAEQFLGRFIEAQLWINGALVTDPIAGPGSTTDSKGLTYGTSAGVVYT